jgi:hypothetical protein
MTTAPVGFLDEREAFEAHYAKIWKERTSKSESLVELAAVLVTMRDGDEYDDGRGSKPIFLNTLWQGWKARSASRQEGWQPIASAPEDVLLVVGWRDPDDTEHPERHDFDYLEDGVWQKHAENVEYFQVCAPPGSRGPKEQAPYTHFMPVGSIPAAPHQAQEAQGDSHGE